MGGDNTEALVVLAFATFTAPPTILLLITVLNHPPYRFELIGFQILALSKCVNELS